MSMTARALTVPDLKTNALTCTRDETEHETRKLREDLKVLRRDLLALQYRREPGSKRALADVERRAKLLEAKIVALLKQADVPDHLDT